MLLLCWLFIKRRQNDLFRYVTYHYNLYLLAPLAYFSIYFSDNRNLHTQNHNKWKFLKMYSRAQTKLLYRLALHDVTLFVKKPKKNVSYGCSLYHLCQQRVTINVLTLFCCKQLDMPRVNRGPPWIVTLDQQR